MDPKDIRLRGYTIVSKLGGGGFGEVFLGTVDETGVHVAIKVEDKNSKELQLRHEYKIYRELEKRSATGDVPEGFCRAYKLDVTSKHSYLVIDLLGSSLSDLFRNKCAKKFSLKTVLQIADQMLDRVDTFFSMHLIHRDISTGNFVIGRGDKADTIYFIDFGMSTRYRDPATLLHNPQRATTTRRGTTRYASINNHQGNQLSRRDDLESIAYILIRFMRGSLPWESLQPRVHGEKTHHRVKEIKINTPIVDLCAGMPQEFADFLAYARGMKFHENPNIPHWRARFRSLYESHGYHKEPFSWDWDRSVSQHRVAHTMAEALLADEDKTDVADVADAAGTACAAGGPARENICPDGADVGIDSARSTLPAPPHSEHSSRTPPPLPPHPVVHAGTTPTDPECSPIMASGAVQAHISPYTGDREYTFPTDQLRPQLVRSISQGVPPVSTESIDTTLYNNMSALESTNSTLQTDASAVLHQQAAHRLNSCTPPSPQLQRDLSSGVVAVPSGPVTPAKQSQDSRGLVQLKTGLIYMIIQDSYESANAGAVAGDAGMNGAHVVTSAVMDTPTDRTADGVEANGAPSAVPVRSTVVDNVDTNRPHSPSKRKRNKGGK